MAKFLMKSASHAILKKNALGCRKIFRLSNCKLLMEVIEILWVASTCLLLHGASTALAEVSAEDFEFYGPGIAFNELPNVLFIVGEIRNNDFLEIRRFVRQNNVEYFVLSSPGGNVVEALQIGAMINDLEIPTVIPSNGNCASSCSFLFFAGQPRLALGQLGVHQFSSNEVIESESVTQYATSEIISFLNEFETPAFVYEHMFRDQEMYFFGRQELAAISTTAHPEYFTELADAEELLEDFYYFLENLVQNPVEHEGSVSEQEVIPGPPPVVPEQRPISALPNEIVSIRTQAAFDRLRIIISRAVGDFQQPVRLPYPEFIEIDPELRRSLLDYVNIYIASYPIEESYLISFLESLVHNEQASLGRDFGVFPDEIFERNLSEYQVHRDWVSARYGNNACIILSYGFSDNEDELVHPPIIAMVANWYRHQDRRFLDFAMPVPNMLRNDHTLSLRIDYEFMEFVTPAQRADLNYEDSYTIDPAPIRDGFVSTAITNRFSTGRSALISGTNSMNGRHAEFTFSLYGFTSAFLRMIDLCDAPELYGWLPQ